MKQLIAAVTALSIGLAAPATAQEYDRELAGLLTGLAVLGLVAAAMDNNDDRPRETRAPPLLD